MSVTDKEALQAGFDLTKTEGILPALESAHAIAALNKMTVTKSDVVVINLSGRGDKELATYLNHIKYEQNKTVFREPRKYSIDLLYVGISAKKYNTRDN